MTLTLVMPGQVAEQITGMVTEPLEQAGVLLAKLTSDEKSARLLALEFHPVRSEHYAEQEKDRLSVTSLGWVDALRRAEEIGAAALWVHSHPGEASSTRPSRRDRIVDEQLAEAFKVRSGQEVYGYLIVGTRSGQLRFQGRIDHNGLEIQVSRLLLIGSRWQLLWPDDRDEPPLEPIFDRQIRAFGGDIQRVLGDLRIALVGCGGTGSAVAEQLVRLGVRHFQLIDPEELSESNVTRVYGSTPGDIGRPKVEILADHLTAIAPDCQVETVQGTVNERAIARRLQAADVIYGCTDDNSGRLVLSRAAYYLLAPVIDCGVILTTDSNDQLDGIHGRVTVLHPGAPCLVCRDRVDLQRAAAETMTDDERDALVEEGYAPALPGIEPAVVAYTTAVAAAAVGELLERLSGYGPLPEPSEVLLRLHEREMSTNAAAPRPHHYCDPGEERLGRADADPFLEQTWPA